MSAAAGRCAAEDRHSLRRVLSGAVVAALIVPLSGCFFIVRHAVETAMAPAHCVANDAKIGDRFTAKGETYEVTKLLGDSPYLCRRSPEATRMGADARTVSS